MVFTGRAGSSKQLPGTATCILRFRIGVLEVPAYGAVGPGWTVTVTLTGLT